VMVELARAQQEAGNRVRIIAGAGPLARDATGAGVDVMEWPLGIRSPVACSFPFRLRRLFQRLGPDVIHVHSRLPAWHAWLALRGMDARDRPGLVSTIHGHYSVSSYSAIMLKADAVVAVSRSVADYMTESFPSGSSRALEVIPPGLDQTIFNRDYRIPDGWKEQHWTCHPALDRAPVICLPGRLTRLKGHHWLVRLLGDLKNLARPATGLLVGGQTGRRRRYRRQILDLATSLGVEDQMVWTPACADVRPWMAMSRVVINVSERPEAYGRTIPESLALGTPAAGFDHGGVGSNLKHMFPAGLVPPFDGSQLARTVGKLIEKAPGVPPVEVPTLEDAGQRYLNVYRQL